MNSVQKFYLERKGEEIKLIFPQPQRHELRTYPITRRRSYTVLEPKYVPDLAIKVSKETAKALFHTLKDNVVMLSHEDNNDWHMTFQAVTS